MKTNKILGSLLAVFAGIVIFAPSQALAAAFGVSPPWIENDSIRAGSNFIYVINLSSNGLSEDMIVQAEVDGAPEIMKWLSIQNKDNLMMPTGQNIVPMSVAVSIPANVPKGLYEGKIRLSLYPKNGQDSNVTTLLGGNVDIRLNVVDHDITDYAVREISVDSMLEGQPIPLKMNLKNLGNTNIEKVVCKVSVIDKKSGKMMFSGTSDQLNMPVSPQTMGLRKLSIPASELSAGIYWVDVEAFKDGASVYKNRLHLSVDPIIRNNTVSTGVSVVEEGMKMAAPKAALQQSANVATSVVVRAPYTNQLIIIVIGLLVVLVAIAGKTYVTLKKKHR